MPLYEYVCPGCHARTSVLATIAELDAGLSPVCATCGGGELRRALSTISTPGRASASALAGVSEGAGSGCCGGGCCGG